MKTRELLTWSMSIATLIGICFGVYFFFENRYALALELERTKQRLEEKISQDRLNSIQERMWKVEDRLEKRKPTDSEKEELRLLKEEKEKLKKSLQK